MSAVVSRATMRLSHYATQKMDTSPKSRLQTSKKSFLSHLSRSKLLHTLSKFSHEAGEYDDQIQVIKKKLHAKVMSDRVQLSAGEKVLYESIIKGKKTGADIAMKVRHPRVIAPQRLSYV